MKAQQIKIKNNQVQELASHRQVAQAIAQELASHQKVAQAVAQDQLLTQKQPQNQRQLKKQDLPKRKQPKKKLQGKLNLVKQKEKQRKP